MRGEPMPVPMAVPSFRPQRDSEFDPEEIMYIWDGCGPTILEGWLPVKICDVAGTLLHYR